MKNRGNIIIIEGAQGVGKSTMANFIRDNLASSNLYRLTGITDKTITGYDKVKSMYLGLINYIESLEESELNLIFDRMFFSEQVYSLLNYKEYDFTETYNRLLKKLSDLDFNIYIVILYLNDSTLFTKRLRRLHHKYQKFSVENSINQQNAYLKLLNNIKSKNIHKLKISTDDFEKAYKKLINKIPILQEAGIQYKKLEDRK